MLDYEFLYVHRTDLLVSQVAAPGSGLLLFCILHTSQPHCFPFWPTFSSISSLLNPILVHRPLRSAGCWSPYTHRTCWFQCCCFSPCCCPLDIIPAPSLNTPRPNPRRRSERRLEFGRCFSFTLCF